MADALFPSVRQGVLRMTYGQPDRWWYLSELAAHIGTSPSSLQRELESLAGAVLLRMRRDGRRTYYRAEENSAIFEELRRVVEKTTGAPEHVGKALEPLAPQIRLALLYGSVARGDEKGTSDIDVLVVADDLNLEELFSALAPAEKRLGRKINPTVLTPAEFRKRRKARNHFLGTVLSGAHVVLIGDENAARAAR